MRFPLYHMRDPTVIEIMPESHGKILPVRASGKLTDADNEES